MFDIKNRIPAKSGGFTLVELLVVMAVIAVLAGMLLPVVGMVRDSARRLVCTTNLRQIGMGLFAYMRDEKSAPWGLTTNSEWRTDLAPYMDVLLPSRSFCCPAVPTGVASTGHYSGHPQFFPWVFSGGTLHPGTIRDLRDDFTMIYDGTQYSDGTTNSYPIAWSVWPVWGWLEWNDTSLASIGNPSDGAGSYQIRFRHRGYANYVFGDLRVASVKDGGLAVNCYRIGRNGRKYGWE